MFKRRAFWITLAVLLLAAGVAGAMLKKPNKAADLQSAAQVPAVMEFLPTDLMQVKPGELRQLMPLTGSLRAFNQASVKAKVAGEVREVLVREGEAVKAGQVLVKMDTSDYQARVEQAKGALLAARGQLEIATKARDNNKALLDKGFISKNAVDNAESQYSIAHANVESARAALDVAQKALADTVIKAPISGLVSMRMVQPGEKVAVDNRLLDVVDLGQMELEAAVPAIDIGHVSLGQEVQVKVEGMPKALTGKVVRINPATQAGSRSIMAYIQIENPQGALRVGMFAEAQLTTAKKSGVLTVPQAAVHTDAGRQFVYAIEGGKLAQKTVTTGLQGDDGTGNSVEIFQGLESGAQVVKANLGTLRAGTPVKITQIAGASAPAQ
ncbi:efflux RND transporter periplasmic adaptor subunit [Noviherbaspirillum denitrificans]|uniref:Efflux transporter periplasmic adaptor subunit n=1 Tax=Noviherbaspirillum denitrificans TaxID=1968433 RepID=A0A254T8Y8_9BURK|nr:efflux RND transporter periplasmic adaptor subunit [Noviherbaspirillum denitrificans]OWW19109.1 efflux transporter periplasmic adaptor subunit [Noviherbaspirillum denitrificans]